ncbi:ComEC/Rec2 family competence protein [Streptomyces sulphureus]|uniref:ComEC/Rec2 family competence protein n=1 Tax=Streptomyces sulphureus TaxID=47758 RepID=UPI000477AE72|nr:ComEC/Rec2 family competence protein [Streptomyces sulphureus]
MAAVRPPRERAQAHAAAANPLGDSDPREEGPPDYRLVPPALCAWGAAAIGLAAPGSWVVTGACAAVVGAVLLLGTAAFGRRRVLLVGTAMAALSAAAAGTGAWLHAADLHRGPLPELAERHARVTVEATVTADPRATKPKVRGAEETPGFLVVPAEVRSVEVRGSSATAVRSPVLLVVPRERVDAGDTHDARAKQERGADTAWLSMLPSTGVRVHAEAVPAQSAGKGGRDLAAVLRVRPGVPQVVRGPSAVQRAAGHLRAGLREASSGLDGDARGLLPGLVVGDTSRLDSGLEEDFRTTDMTHLLAVSGSNLTVMLVLLIGRPSSAGTAERGGLAPRFGISLRQTAGCAGLLTLGFVVVCRPDPSVLRAAACGLVAVLAIATGRRRSLLPALAAAVLLLVLYDPWLARDFGFLLSVLATASLLTVAPGWSAALHRRGVPHRLAEALAASAAAQLACAPVVAVLAAHLSLVAVPCNLLAEFAVAPATVLGFATLALAPLLPPVAETCAWLASWPTEAIATIARAGASLPGAEVDWPGSWSGALLLAAATLLLCLLVGRAPVLRRRWACALGAGLLVLALTRPAPLVGPLTGWPPAGWAFAVCDVGQGDALALATGRPGEAVVVDAGPDAEAADECLRALGVTAVPALFLTHFHADHVSGLSGVLRGRSVHTIHTSPFADPPGQAAAVRRTAADAGVPLEVSTVGERRRVADLSWEVLWPIPPEAGAPAPSGPNDASVTLLARTRGLSLLLPGDLEPAAQRRLLTEHPDLPRVDVLKVAHHGSRYQEAALLDRIRPRTALVSAGSDNTYGHPAHETLQALEELGAVVARTDTQGALAVTEAEGRPSVVAERGER